jgi:anti-sigma regulatory factor (Ser/Thr protein kinase)
MADRDVLVGLPGRAPAQSADDGHVLTGTGTGSDLAGHADLAGHSDPAGSPAVGCAVRAESRTFAGLRSEVRVARHWLARLVAGHHAADDAQLALSELAANAVSHSRSGAPGGTFTVRVVVGHGAVRVEVADEGGAWHGARPAGDGLSGSGVSGSGVSGSGLSGRGLEIVAAVASAWGISGDGGGRVAWCLFEPGEAARPELYR